MTMNPSTEEDVNPPVNPIISEDTSSENTEEFDSVDKEDREDSRFKEGQILRFVRVRFPGNSRSFPFLIGKRRIEYGQKVVAMSDRGMAVGYVNSFPYDVPFNKSMLPVRSISKIATDEDIVKDKEAYRQQKNAENICNDLIEHYKLDMHLTHVEFTSFGKKAVFYFIAPARVDFRELVKDLVGRLKTRIELRQISVRDRSASVGGIGPCGLELCCSSFLTKYGNVGIKMAKNQDLTLNFSKLNGVCGQLKCCLQYEDDVYKDKRSHLPKEGEFIVTHTNEMGRVDRLHLLNEQFVMMTNRGIRKRYAMEMFKEAISKEDAKFPNEFDSISDETHKVIGLEESQKNKARLIEAEVKTYKEASKNFADAIFQDLFGEKTLDYSLPNLQEPESGNTRKIMTPDEEEEIYYKQDEDDMLPEDDDSFVTTNHEVTLRGHSSDRDNRDQRPHNRDRQQHNNHNQNRSGGGQQRHDRGPRQDNRNSNRDQRPNQTQGQNNNRNNQGRRPR